MGKTRHLEELISVNLDCHSKKDINDINALQRNSNDQLYTLKRNSFYIWGNYDKSVFAVFHLRRHSS